MEKLVLDKCARCVDLKGLNRPRSGIVGGKSKVALNSRSFSAYSNVRRSLDCLHICGG